MSGDLEENLLCAKMKMDSNGNRKLWKDGQRCRNPSILECPIHKFVVFMENVLMELIFKHYLLL